MRTVVVVGPEGPAHTKRKHYRLFTLTPMASSSPLNDPSDCEPGQRSPTSRPVMYQTRTNLFSPRRGLVGAALELVDDGGIGERRGVAEVAALGDVAQQAAHDLAAAGLGQVRGEVDRLRLGDRADLGGDVIAQVGDVDLRAAAQRDVGDDRLPGRRVVGADDGRLGDRRVRHEGALDLGGRDAVAADVHHVVDAAEQPEVAVVVELGAVAGEVAAGEPAPVRVAVALGIAPDAAQHRRPRVGEREVAAAMLDVVAVVVDDLGADARQRERRRARLDRGRARQRADHDPAGLGLPPRVDHRACGRRRSCRGTTSRPRG